MRKSTSKSDKSLTSKSSHVDIDHYTHAEMYVLRFQTGICVEALIIRPIVSNLSQRCGSRNRLVNVFYRDGKCLRTHNDPGDTQPEVASRNGIFHPNALYVGPSIRAHLQFALTVAKVISTGNIIIIAIASLTVRFGRHKHPLDSLLARQSVDKDMLILYAPLCSILASFSLYSSTKPAAHHPLYPRGQSALQPSRDTAQGGYYAVYIGRHVRVSESYGQWCGLSR